MSKKMVGEKNAAFSAGWEEFSIHTVEISRLLTEWEYRKIRAFLYDEIKSSYKEADLSDYNVMSVRRIISRGFIRSE